MFVDNRTRFEVALPKGLFAEGVSVAALVVTVAYRITDAGLVPWEGPREPLPTDPPDSANRPLWHGTGVTAAGTARGPGRAPHTAHVDLRVGAESRRLVVTGDRKWVKNAGKLVASLPAPWDAMPLSWSLAFGGSVDVPPGPFGPEGLPHPGGTVVFPLNPGGKGLVLDEAKAEGAPLPNIESPGAAMKAPLDRPRPAGFAPCPDLAGLRAPADVPEDFLSDFDNALRLTLRMRHAAPGDLVFEGLSPGTEVELRGVGERVLAFELPRCPVSVAVRKGKKATALPAAIRSVHVSGDDGAAVVCFGHPFSYEEAPAWVMVKEG
jgi:hypothetical protein